jgi:hypothetical protein
MMGERRVMQEALFYGFSLERHVPDNHLVREIDRFVDLSEVRTHLEPYYSETGQLDAAPHATLVPSNRTSRTDVKRNLRIAAVYGSRLHSLSRQALIPKQSGQRERERDNSNWRDAVTLAGLHRAAGD